MSAASNRLPPPDGSSSVATPGVATPGGMPPSPPAPVRSSRGSSSGSRSLPALLAAAGLVVVVVVLVLLFGIARPPELATVQERPAPSPEAGIAWSQWDDGDTCIHTVDPQGVRTEVGCGYESQELIAWTEDGIVVLVWGPREAAELIDPATGDVVGQIDGTPEDWLEAGGGAVHSRHVDGTLTVTLRQSGEVLWRVEAPETYGVNDGVLSPDGRFVVLVDHSERLLLVPADGSAEPRVWAEVEESWIRPVWEGSAVPDADSG
jgi:hypothetical protein